MSLISVIFTTIVAIEAFGIMLIEMFATAKQLAKQFELPLEITSQRETKILLANQGLYNGFVGAMTLLALYGLPDAARFRAAYACVIFVIIAALFGAITSGKSKILLVQGTPAIIALIILFIFK